MTGLQHHFPRQRKVTIQPSRKYHYFSGKSATVFVGGAEWKVIEGNLTPRANTIPYFLPAPGHLGICYSHITIETCMSVISYNSFLPHDPPSDSRCSWSSPPFLYTARQTEAEPQRKKKLFSALGFQIKHLKFPTEAMLVRNGF
jgi:hypothetical protein